LFAKKQAQKFKSYEVERTKTKTMWNGEERMSSGKTLAGGGIVGLILLLINGGEMSKC
jgi:hypothetical protein